MKARTKEFAGKATLKYKNKAKMDSNFITMNESELRKLIHAECDKQRDLMYMEVTQDVLPQLMAVSMYALECKGWRKQRLENFLTDVIGAYKLLNDGIFGKKFDPVDLIEHFKEKYDIDLDKELHSKRA